MVCDPEETCLWKLKSRTSIFILSVISIILFVVDLIFQICGILVRGKYSSIGSGIWCGAVFGATGAYGLYLLRKDCPRKKLAFLSMVGFSTPFTLILMGISGYSVSFRCPCDSSYINLACDGQQILWIASNVVLIVSGVTSFVTSLLTAFIIVFSKKGRIDKEVTQSKPKNPEDPQHFESHENGDTKSETSSKSIPDSGVYTSIESDLNDRVKEQTRSKLTKTESVIYDDHHTEMDSTCQSSTNSLQNWSPSIDAADSDDDTEASKNIELSMEDIIIHAPPSNYCNSSSTDD